MLIEVAVGKVGKWATSESGDTLEMTQLELRARRRTLENGAARRQGAEQRHQTALLLHRIGERVDDTPVDIAAVSGQPVPESVASDRGAVEVQQLERLQVLGVALAATRPTRSMRRR